MRINFKKIPTMLYVFIFSFLTLAGCSLGSGDVPTESAARQFYETNFKELVTPGILKIESFKKTNGIKREELGSQIYELEYQAELSFPNGWLPQCVDNTHYDAGCYMARLQGAKPKKASSKESDTGKVIFEKTENGWRAKALQAKWI